MEEAKWKACVRYSGECGVATLPLGRKYSTARPMVDVISLNIRCEKDWLRNGVWLTDTESVFLCGSHSKSSLSCTCNATQGTNFWFLFIKGVS